MTKEKWTDLGAALFWAALGIGLVGWRLWQNPLVAGYWLLAAQYAVFVALFILRRPAQAHADTIQWALAAGASVLPIYVLQPAGWPTGWPVIIQSLGIFLQLVGLGTAALALAFLGRQFGLAATYRGEIVTNGLYRLLRHPAYAAELLSVLGFCLLAPSIVNVMVLVILALAQVLRVRAEEALLAKADPAYAAYQAHVRWRLLPGVW